jgi:hypothetical protein
MAHNLVGGVAKLQDANEKERHAAILEAHAYWRKDDDALNKKADWKVALEKQQKDQARSGRALKDWPGGYAEGQEGQPVG